VASRVMGFSKGTTNQSSSSVTFITLSFSGHPRKVSFGEQEACSGIVAPSDLTDEQRCAIRQHSEILDLRREKRELYEEMRSLTGTIQNAQEPFPDLYHRHEAVKRSSPN
jgi:hypothetical protein